MSSDTEKSLDELLTAALRQLEQARVNQTQVKSVLENILRERYPETAADLADRINSSVDAIHAAARSLAESRQKNISREAWVAENLDQIRQKHPACDNSPEGPGRSLAVVNFSDQVQAAAANFLLGEPSELANPAGETVESTQVARDFFTSPFGDPVEASVSKVVTAAGRPHTF